MNISIDLPGVTYFIKSYTPGTLSLSTGVLYHESVMITPESCTLWSIQTFENLTPLHLIQLLTPESDVVLLGTGVHQRFLPPELLKLSAQYQKPIEVMNSKAACRTYNLLASEGRQVVLGLIVV